MPLTQKGEKIMSAMKRQYGSKKGERVFYASKNKGKIKGTEYSNKHAGSHCMTKAVGVIVSGTHKAAHG